MPAIPIDLVRDLLRHMEWADASVWRAVVTCPASADDNRLRVVLLHMHGVQRAFLSVWTSQPPPAPPSGVMPGLPDLQQSARSYYEALWAALPTFGTDALRRPIQMPGLEPYEQQFGRRFDRPTMAETMLQVASHSTYHRGQANARLREIGGAPPNADYIAWIWFGRPEAEWPAGMAA